MAEFVIDATDAQLGDEFDARAFFGPRLKEEIVRCKECEYRRRHWNGLAPNFTANFFCAYTGGHEVRPDGFCAWGERRDA